MTEPAKHILYPARPSPPSCPGALDAWECSCSCGFTARTSLGAAAAIRDAGKHMDWANRTGN